MCKPTLVERSYYQAAPILNKNALQMVGDQSVVQQQHTYEKPVFQYTIVPSVGVKAECEPKFSFSDDQLFDILASGVDKWSPEPMNMNEFVSQDLFQSTLSTPPPQSPLMAPPVSPLEKFDVSDVEVAADVSSLCDILLDSEVADILADVNGINMPAPSFPGALDFGFENYIDSDATVIPASLMVNPEIISNCPTTDVATPRGCKSAHKTCTHPGCTKFVRSRGLCKAHGGSLQCIVDGCSRQSQGNGLCIKHGGGRRCEIDGCSRAAQSNRRCKKHGGGQRCIIDGCIKSSQGGGLCRSHGGGQRCGAVGCMKGAQRDGYCAAHGGIRLCIVPGCNRNDRGGGRCAYHGGGRRCKVGDCTKSSRKHGLCAYHYRISHKDGNMTSSPEEHLFTDDEECGSN